MRVEDCYKCLNKYFPLATILYSDAMELCELGCVATAILKLNLIRLTSVLCPYSRFILVLHHKTQLVKCVPFEYIWQKHQATFVDQGSLQAAASVWHNIDFKACKWRSHRHSPHNHSGQICNQLNQSLITIKIILFLTFEHFSCYRFFFLTIRRIWMISIVAIHIRFRCGEAMENRKLFK